MWNFQHSSLFLYLYRGNPKKWVTIQDIFKKKNPDGINLTGGLNIIEYSKNNKRSTKQSKIERI